MKSTLEQKYMLSALHSLLMHWLTSHGIGLKKTASEELIIDQNLLM